MPFRSSRTAPPGPRRPVAPIHRGPQAVTQHHAGNHTIHHAPNAALLIDFDNVTMGIRSDLQTELKNLLASDIIKGKVSVQRAYADWRRYPQYIVPLAESSIDMIMAPAYGSAKKNATDIRLAIDALELVFVRPEIGTFILLSGDSDFSSLVIKLKEYGKYVIGVGIRESSSDLLVMNCDEYYSYNSLAGLVRSGEEEVVKHDPWELVTEAVQRMKRNGDVMRADRLKQVMQQIDSSFDEKNVGKSKFSLFVSEAAKRGLLSLTKLENGQLEVDVPRAGTQPAAGEQAGAASAAPSLTVVADAAEESVAARRGRRGGRGRSRDREERTPREAVSQSPTATEAPAISSASALVMGTDAMDDGTAPQHTPVRGDDAPSRTAPSRTAPSRPAPSRPAPARSAAPSVAAAPDDSIGASGIRLTRDEAFDLVRRAVASLDSGDAPVAASKVRGAARTLLGRDTESLSERNFVRILHDAHDADVIDLRRRGGDYEVAASVSAPPVERQLEAAATANAPVAKPVVAAARGMSARGTGRGPMGGRGTLPAHLMNVGMVAPRVAPASAASAQVNIAKPAEAAAALTIVHETAPHEVPAPAARKRGAVKKAKAKGTKTKVAGEAKAPAAKRARPVRKKAKGSAKSTSGAGSEE